MSSKVYIAGLGVISAIGNNVDECFAALKSGEAGIGDINYLKTIYKHEIPVAEVKLDNTALASMADMPEHVSRTALLSTVAAKEALNDSGVKNIEGLRIGFVSANTVGGMDKTERFYEEFITDPDAGEIEQVRNHGCGNITELVADQLGVNHYTTTISTACSSSANAIFYGARLIRSGMVDVVIAGGVDAFTKFTLNGFNTLMILDRNFCKPFDEERKGLNLGEGAAYVVLVSEQVAQRLVKKPYATLSGYNNSNDAYHQTASSPDGDGPYLAMQGALKKANLQPADIDYINLHGTGTPNNDASEGRAITRIFDGNYPPLSSTKSYTGHTLGASGAVEAVFSVLALQHGVIYPNLRFETPMKELPFTPQKDLLQGQEINHVLSNSFGFGGNCSSLIFSKV
ncbi:beta-ketoacyl-[acyl-carrier-protein] synthase family protein [Mucilaginibacter sp. KACC 22063]|uniref:beta-ketoacyl-[acyl-carrier-protein] synthase family protein n=1 Tax=Mucilaginibacter sp. KACC 22063 TaxID=3025666 RepID=UPI002366E787|nr:beta-ketoacyl-[acyl-carrier-protein] synthase family protein [Mucilaginibacter sp. KACC 22063]WDF55019.1 beta-ketoacyl-[acyl-carrier-protein] synthase family protein [Mucilaginibacter sp. KACC 22063]